jgi:hypothetical protein
MGSPETPAGGPLVPLWGQGKAPHFFFFLPLFNTAIENLYVLLTYLCPPGTE